MGLARLETSPDRFMLKMIFGEDCWEWSGYIDKETGYGRFASRYVVWAHRFSYELFVGEIPKGMTVDHLCRNHKCVNPWHLEAVTQRVNILRGNAPCAVTIRRGTCKYGHDITDDKNVYLVPGTGKRSCRKCRNRLRLNRKRAVREALLHAPTGKRHGRPCVA